MRQEIPKVVWVVAAIALLLALLNFVTIIIALRHPGGNSYPKNVVVQPEKIDYNKITEIIKQQLMTFPKPKDGQSITGPKGDSVKGDKGEATNGRDGVNGQSVTADQIAQAVADYLQLNPPAQGEPGTAGKSPEFRCVADAHRVDLRFTGETQWQVLFFFAPGGSCP